MVRSSFSLPPGATDGFFQHMETSSTAILLFKREMWSIRKDFESVVSWGRIIARGQRSGQVCNALLSVSGHYFAWSNTREQPPFPSAEALYFVPCPLQAMGITFYAGGLI